MMNCVRGGVLCDADGFASVCQRCYGSIQEELNSPWIEEVNKLRRKLPSAKRNGGKPDPQALRKLLDEFVEFAQSNFLDTSELADIAYYAAGSVIADLLTEKQAKQYVEQACALVPLGMTFEEAIIALKAKYGYRAQQGNPKDHEVERGLIYEALNKVR